MSNITTTGTGGSALSTLMAAAKRKLESSRGKLIFGFDATASRGAAWTSAQALQREMFRAAKNLDVQLAVFRGDELLISSWEHDADKLEALMAEITVDAGSTQIQRLLQHIFDENLKDTKRPVNAFVFIGDTFEESHKKPAIMALCKALGDLKIPGFFFLESSGFAEQFCATIYAEMASLTGGAYSKFDSTAVKFLSDLLESVATFATGGLAALVNRDSDAARLLLTQLKK